MRLITTVLLAGSAFAQIPLIGVNSSGVTVPAGSRDTVAAITVDPSKAGGDLLAIMLTSEDLQIRVELPDGRLVTKENASSLGSTWESAGQGKGDAFLLPGRQGTMNHLLVLPPNAPAGVYKIHADAGKLKEESGIVLEFLPLGNPAGPLGRRETVAVGIVSPETFHYDGDKVQLLAGVFEGNRGVNNAQLSASAVAVNQSGIATGQPMPVPFQPSGPGADGSYTAALPTTATGEYYVRLTVRGKRADGTDFERVAGTSVRIEPRRAQIIAATERPVDEDGNGLIDRIEVTAQVKVQLAGNYFLTVDLKAAGGKHMQANGEATLGVGAGTITAAFDRYSLTHVEADGPYSISARLFRRESDNSGFASLLDNAGMTRAYKRSSFDRGPIYFVGTAQAAPQSANGRSPFDKLVVSLDVFTPGGDCHWHGGLKAGETDLSQYENNNGVLPKGVSKVTLTFDGLRISDEADGKSLSIRDTGLGCEPLSAYLEKSVSLGEFPSGTFVKPPPSFDFDEFPAVSATERGQVATFGFEIRTYGGFNGTLELSADGLPSGFRIQELPPNRQARLPYLPTTFRVSAPATTPPGRYEFTVRAKSGTLERAKKFTVIVR